MNVGYKVQNLREIHRKTQASWFILLCEFIVDKPTIMPVEEISYGFTTEVWSVLRYFEKPRN